MLRALVILLIGSRINRSRANRSRSSAWLDSIDAMPNAMRNGKKEDYESTTATSFRRTHQRAIPKIVFAKLWCLETLDVGFTYSFRGYGVGGSETRALGGFAWAKTRANDDRSIYTSCGHRMSHAFFDICKTATSHTELYMEDWIWRCNNQEDEARQSEDAIMHLLEKQPLPCTSSL